MNQVFSTNPDSELPGSADVFEIIFLQNMQLDVD